LTERTVTGNHSALLEFNTLASDYRTINLEEIIDCEEGDYIYVRNHNMLHKGLNKRENYLVFSLANAGATARGNLFTLADGTGTSLTTTDITHVHTLWESVSPYATQFAFVMGRTVDNDLKLMDWIKDKNTGAYFEKIEKTYNCKLIRHSFGKNPYQFYYRDMNASVPADTLTSVLADTRAYFIGLDTEVGKPFIFVRKNMDLFKRLLGGFQTFNLPTMENQMTDRLVIFKDAPQTNVDLNAQQLKVGMSLAENIATATKNTYAMAQFDRE